MDDSLMDLLQGYEPTIQEDFEPVDFDTPVSCGAKAEVKEFVRDAGIGKTSGERKDIFKLRMQITEVVSAKTDKEKMAAKNRYLDRVYFVTPNKFQTTKEVIEEIMDDCKTAKHLLILPKDKKMDEADLLDYVALHLHGLEGKILDVRCYPGKKKDGKSKQKVKIVDRGVPTTKSDVPF